MKYIKMSWGQILELTSEQIYTLGLNPYCCNEGLADKDTVQDIDVDNYTKVFGFDKTKMIWEIQNPGQKLTNNQS